MTRAKAAVVPREAGSARDVVADVIAGLDDGDLARIARQADDATLAGLVRLASDGERRRLFVSAAQGARPAGAMEPMRQRAPSPPSRQRNYPKRLSRAELVELEGAIRGRLDAEAGRPWTAEDLRLSLQRDRDTRDLSRAALSTVLAILRRLCKDKPAAYRTDGRRRQGAFWAAQESLPLEGSNGAEVNA